MGNLTKEELETLQELLNEEILSYLDSGYNLNSDHVILLRNLIKKFGLKEIYNFEKRGK